MQLLVDMIDCKSIFWLHTPKTSSSLCLTMRHICCPDIFKTFVSNYSSVKSESKYETTSRYEPIISHGCVDLHKTAFQRNNTKSIPLSFLCPYGFNRNHEPFNIQDHQLIDYKNASFSSPSDKRSSTLKKYFGIIIIREPSSRLVSAFLDGKHSEGMPYEEIKRMHSRHGQYQPKGKLNTTARMLYAFDDYIQYPHFIGYPFLLYCHFLLILKM